MATFEIPPGARKSLAEVIRYHQDRDDFPVFFGVFYLLRHEQLAPMQAAYDAAVAVLKASIEAASTDFRQELIETTGQFSSEGFLSPTAVEKLRGLDEAERVAHAWAAYYIFAKFGTLEPYLEPGVPKESRLIATYPELTDLLTPKDYLLPVGQDVQPGHAWVSYKGHDVHPHPGLRRGFRSRVHYEFLRLLWEQRSDGNNVSLAVDHFRLCPRGELPRFMELDAWFGAPFRVNEVDVPWKVGATVHGRSKATSPSDPAGLLTEFRWTYADGLKALEIEELLPPAMTKMQPHGPVIGRYVHSIRDTIGRRFVHLDGALMLYEEDSHKRRYEQATNHHESKVWAERKVKLFRIDVPQHGSRAQIRDSAWSELITSFFRGNELVLEYFDGRPFAEIYRSRYGQEFPYWD